MKCSIRNSCLLIAFLYRTHKHQLGDFFNSHECCHYDASPANRWRRVRSRLKELVASDSGNLTSAAEAKAETSRSRRRLP